MNKATFDTVIHAPNRLQICALLDSSKELEFQIIREQLDVSDSVLSKHLKVLEDANYVQLSKKIEFMIWFDLYSSIEFLLTFGRCQLASKILTLSKFLSNHSVETN